MDFDVIQDYIVGQVPQRPAEMLTMEAYAAEHRFPIIGPAAGYYCYQVARMIGARRIFELGSGYGYSTAWFAKAVRENGGGVVHHVVWDDDLSSRARRHLAALGYGDLVEFHVSEAVATLQETDGPFDLIFNDIDKQDYPKAMPPIIEKLQSGGALIIDNMFRNGRTFDADDHTAATEGVREVTRQLVEGPEWISTLIPIRDGLMVAYRTE